MAGCCPGLGGISALLQLGFVMNSDASNTQQAPCRASWRSHAQQPDDRCCSLMKKLLPAAASDEEECAALPQPAAGADAA
jgi:hypothetical protein